MRYKIRLVPGGRRVETCDHGLSRRSSRVKGKSSYELGWKVEVMISVDLNDTYCFSFFPEISAFISPNSARVESYLV